MKKTGEWGEFFPTSLAPFSYNITMAQDHMPLSKEEILTKNFTWTDPDQNSKYDGPTYKIPDSINDVNDDICDKILTCSKSGQNYKIQKNELQFCRSLGLPIPTQHHEIRFKERANLRNPRKLHTRKCDKCHKEIQTTFAPDRPEKVYCEPCYLDEIN